MVFTSQFLKDVVETDESAGSADAALAVYYGRYPSSDSFV